MYLSACLVVVVIGVVGEALRRYRSRSRCRWRELSKFPGDYPWPLIGNALQLGFDADVVSHKLLEIWNRLGKSNFRLTVGSEEWVMLCEPDDVGAILSHASELSKPPERNACMMPFFGNSLSTAEGERWRSVRKLVTPSFHFKTLEYRVEFVNARSKRLLEILEQYNGEPVNLYRYLRPFMYDVLCNTLMGVDKNLLEDPDHPYLLASGRVVDIVTQNYFSYWRNIGILFSLTPMYREMMNVIKVLRNMSDKIIYERRLKLNSIISETRMNNKDIDIDLEEVINEKLSTDICLLDSLILSKLPNGDPLPDEIINEEISLLCFTGHYTTTKSICHTLYCLAKYPEIQQRVYEEQRSIFNNDSLRDPTHQDLNEMKYLEVVIKESIRVIPTVTKIGRHLQNDLALKDGRIIPAGTTVIVYYEGLFNNTKVFPDPEKYKPERFFEPNMHTFAYTPFSAGPRNCIGFRYAWVAMKATLSNILRKFEVVEGGPGCEPQFAYRIITESVNGIHLSLRKRKHVRV